MWFLNTKKFIQIYNFYNLKEVKPHIGPIKNELKSPTLSHTYSDFFYDSEDEKPLKLFMSKHLVYIYIH